MLKPGCCLPYAPGCTASIYQKSLWFVFDLVYVVLWLLVAVHFISELTRFELIITGFGIIMSIKAQLSELMCLMQC